MILGSEKEKRFLTDPYSLGGTSEKKPAPYKKNSSPNFQLSECYICEMGPKRGKPKKGKGVLGGLEGPDTNSCFSWSITSPMQKNVWNPVQVK